MSPVGARATQKSLEPAKTDNAIVFRVIFLRQKLLPNIWNMFPEKLLPAQKKFPNRSGNSPTRPEIFAHRPLAGTGERSDFSTFREHLTPPYRKAQNEKA